MKMKRRVRSPLHHPAFATLTTGGPPPPLSRGRKASAAILAARFSSHPSHRHAISKNDAANPTFVRCPGQWNGRTHHDRGGARRFVARRFVVRRFVVRRFTLRNARTTKEVERRQTRVSLLHLPAKRAPWPGRARLSAFHCGSCRGDSWSPRLSVRPCFPGQSGAFGPVRPLQPGGGDLARLHGRYPRRNKSQCSEHLTCRSLCRQADARRRPSAERTNPLPASTGPAPASPSSPGWRPVRGARQRLLVLVA